MSVKFILPMALVLLTACAESVDEGSDAVGADFTGVLGRTAADAWVGDHEVQVLGSDGQVLCAEAWTVQAVEASECVQCALTVRIQRTERLDSDCAGMVETGLIPDETYLRFASVPSPTTTDAGYLMVADDLRGPWFVWASAELTEDTVHYDRALWRTHDGTDYDDFDAEDIRDLPSP